jgi:hypothetical protein
VFSADFFPAGPRKDDFLRKYTCLKKNSAVAQKHHLFSLHLTWHILAVFLFIHKYVNPKRARAQLEWTDDS